jgi:site-specific recombinase XerD
VIELVKRQPPKAEAKVTLEDAAWRFIDYRERQGRSAATLAGLKTRLLGESGFIRHCGRELLADVQEADCREFIMRPARPTTARNNLTVLKNFLSWCVRMGLRRDSPADRVDMPARERGKAPAILTPEDTAAFMEALRGHRDGSFVAYYALLLFAGLRPSEVTELQEDDIRTTGIRVTGGKMRGRARRIAPMLPSLRSWLAAYPVDWAVLGMRTDARAFTDARKLCPARWETDVARHSFISYRLAVVHDERQVAREAGNSPDMIFAHYFEMADRREAGRYFSIRP